MVWWAIDDRFSIEIITIDIQSRFSDVNMCTLRRSECILCMNL